MIELGELRARCAASGAAPAETTEVHTRILRLALGIDEARAYWAHVDPAVPPGAARAPGLRAALVRREDARPREDAAPLPRRPVRRLPGGARRAPPLAPHGPRHAPGHLPLARPAHRPHLPALHRRVPRRAAHAQGPEGGSPGGGPLAAPDLARTAGRRPPIVQFASKLLSAASEAGLVSPKRDPRALLFPKVPDHAIAYLLLPAPRRPPRRARSPRTPYVASVGLGDGFLDQRLKTIPAITLRRMGALVELDWAHPTLTAWAEATL